MIIVLGRFVTQNILSKHGGKICSIEPVDGTFNRKCAIFERIKLVEIAKNVADGLWPVVGSE